MNKKNDERTRNQEGVKEMRWNITPSYTCRRVVRPFASPALSVLALLGSLAMASPAAAQVAPTAQDAVAAKAAFDKGLADMEATRYATGCPLLTESQRLDPRAGTLFTLAVCESQWGRFATAIKRFDEYMRLYEGLPPDEQARQAERFKVAQQERFRAAQDAPLLTLTLPLDAPAGTVVKRNGEVVDKAQFNTEVAVDPGEVVVSTQAPGGPVWEQRIKLEKQQHRQLTLEVKPVPKTVAQPAGPTTPTTTQPTSTSADQGPGARRTAAYIAGGVGIAGLVLGGVMGGLVLGKKGIVSDHCGEGIGSSDPGACDVTGRDAADSAGTLGLVSTIGFAVGLAGLGTATVLLLTEPEQTKTQALMNQGSTKQHQGSTKGSPGRWVSAGLLSAGPKGALAGVQGAF